MDNDRETLRQKIRSQISCDRFLEKSAGGLYCCPFCGSGRGSNRTGALKVYDTNTWHCHACHKSGDAIDLYQKAEGVGYNEALSLMAVQFGMAIDLAATNCSVKRPQSDFNGVDKANFLDVKKTSENGDKTPSAAYYEVCRGQLDDPAAEAYLHERGIRLETAAAFELGFDPAWQSPTAVAKGKNPPKSPRLIIPIGKGGYIARDIRQQLPDNEKKFVKMKEGEAGLFNAAALYNDKESPVFITEGEIDALSVIEIGGQAAALGSASNVRKLLETLKARRTDNTLILCLDNDEAGKKAEGELAEGLQELNVSYVRADICGGRKDPNEALTTDREAFSEAVRKVERETACPDCVSDYISQLMAEEISKFKEGANRCTGYANLDKAAGGIYPGLYILGAVSSLGKTTFMHQMGDQMAAAGEHVLYFSLEQSRLEMVSKSFSRMTAQSNIRKAVSSLQIRAGNLTREVLDAVNEYTAAAGKRLSVIEGNFHCTISFIGEYVGNYMKRNRVKPVVIVDYLQIIRADNQRQSMKEAVDSNVTELKRLSRLKDIPIFLISSLNRANYLVPVDFESFKESGGIEYTADVIWGLQLSAMNDEIFHQEKKLKDKRERVRQAKVENPRQIELVCLKNRYGISSYRVGFDYYPQYDLFVPKGEMTTAKRRYR